VSTVDPVSATDEAKGAARDVVDSRPMKAAARSGYAVNGLLHVVIGIIAIRIATGGGGRGQADQSGALGQIARTPGGTILLWVMVVGLAALGIWQIVQIFFERADDDKKVWGRRISDIGKAVVYLAIAWTALTFARGGSSNSTSSSKTASAKLLAAPGGVFLLVAVGLVVVGIGVFFVYRGVSRSFLKDLKMPPEEIRKSITVTGTVGYIAKGIALGVVGILFVVAAVTFDPSKATGLDGALLTLASLPSGFAILLVVGVGLICYGVYCGARAVYGRQEKL
jgi:TM2 domain-containing membrane protein YozV